MSDNVKETVEKVVSDEPSKTSIEGAGGARGFGETVADGAYNVTKYVWDTAASGVTFVAGKTKEAGSYVAGKGSEAGHFVASKVDELKNRVGGDAGAQNDAEVAAQAGETVAKEAGASK